MKLARLAKRDHPDLSESLITFLNGLLAEVERLGARPAMYTVTVVLDAAHTFPLRFKHQVRGAPAGVFVAAAQDLTAQGQPVASVGNAGWSLVGDEVLVSTLDGLEAGHSYRITFAVLASSSGSAGFATATVAGRRGMATTAADAAAAAAVAAGNAQVTADGAQGSANQAIAAAAAAAADAATAQSTADAAAQSAANAQAAAETAELNATAAAEDAIDAAASAANAAADAAAAATSASNAASAAAASEAAAIAAQGSATDAATAAANSAAAALASQTAADAAALSASNAAADAAEAEAVADAARALAETVQAEVEQRVKLDWSNAVDIPGAKLALGSVSAQALADGSVSAAKIALDAITADKIAAGAVGQSALADGAVSTSKLALGAVSAQALADGSVSAVKIALDAITADKIADGAVTSAKVAQDAIDVITGESAAYVRSRGMNLVTNGSALLGDNTNFSAFTFTGAEACGGGGSFYIDSLVATTYSDEYIAVDPSKFYELRVWAKSATAAPVTRAYLGLLCYDIDKLVIAAYTTHFFPASNTVLAQPLKPGDTVVYLQSGAGWTNDPSWTNRGLIIWGYRNSFGYRYPDFTYSRYAWNFTGSTAIFDVGGVSGNTVTLRVPLPASMGNPDHPNGEWPAGTPISQGRAGNTSGNLYLAGVNVTVPSEWTEFRGTIGGTELSGYSSHTKFPPGAAFARLLFLLNRDTAGVACRTYLANIWLSEIAAQNLANGTVAGEKLVDGAVSNTKLADGAVTTPKLVAGAVTTEKLAAGAVTAQTIAAGAVTAGKIAADAVGTAQLIANAVTAGKIAADAVGTTQLIANAVTAGKIAADAVGTDQLVANAVTAGKVAAGAITTDKLAAGAITAEKIVAGAVGTEALAALAVTTAKLDAAAVTADKIAAGAITTEKLDAAAVTADKIAAGAITTEKLDAAAVTADKIAAGEIGTDKLSFTPATSTNVIATINASTEGGGTLKIAASKIQIDGSATFASGYDPTTKATPADVSAAQAAAISTAAADATAKAGMARTDAVEDVKALYGHSGDTTKIDGGKIYTNSITADKIAAGAITTEKLDAAAVTADKIAAGAITAEKLNAGSIVTRAIYSNYGDNLWPNGNSETPPPAGATADVLESAEFAKRSSISPYQGTHHRLFAAAPGAPDELSITVPAIEGEAFYFEALARLVDEASIFTLRLVNLSSAGNEVSSSTATWDDVTSSYYRKGIFLTATSTTVAVKLEMKATKFSGGPADIAYVDNIRAIRTGGVNLDGTIATRIGFDPSFATFVDPGDPSHVVVGLAVGEAWHIVGAAGEPAFAPGIANAGGVYTPTRFKKVHGIVYVQVAINRTVGDGSPIFTLPNGYRPSGRLMFAAISNNLGEMSVDADGTVRTMYQLANPLVVSAIFPADQ